MQRLGSGSARQPRLHARGVGLRTRRRSHLRRRLFALSPQSLLGLWRRRDRKDVSSIPSGAVPDGDAARGIGGGQCGASVGRQVVAEKTAGVCRLHDWRTRLLV